MMRRPLVLFTVCWVLGSAAAAGLAVSGIVLAGGAMVAALLALLLRRRASWPLAAACLTAFGVAAGERMWADAHNATALPELYAAAAAAAVPDASTLYEVEASGTIVSAVEVDGDRVQFQMTAEFVAVMGEQSPRVLGGERLLVQVRLAAQPDQTVAAAWQRGDRVRLAGTLGLPAEATNFGGFDYRRYLHSQRIHWLLKVKGVAAVETGAGSRWSTESLLGRIDSIRAWLGSRFDELYPAEQSGYMKGLVLGISEDLDPERFRQFSQLGLTHILAISGLHVAVFLYVLGGMLRLLRMTRERMLLIMIAAVPLYVLLAGGSPSVIRAGMMAMLGLTAARMNKLKDGLHLLAAAALIMLAWDPYMLGNVSFQLSFIVTAGLIIGVPPVRRWLPQSTRWKAFYDLIAVTIVAQAVSFPLTVFYFNGFHPLSLPANFILVPFISFIVMPLGGASLILDSIWSPAAQLLAAATSIANELTFGFVLKLSEMQSLQLIWATPPLLWVVYMYIVLGLLFFLLGRGHRNREESSGDKQEADAISSTSISLSKSSIPLPISDPSISTSPPKRSIPQPLSASSISLPLLDLSSQSGKMTAPLGKGASSPNSLFMHRTPNAGYKKHPFRRFVPAIMAAALIIPLMWAYKPDWQNTDAVISIIDVGQGDAILIRSASGKHVLIDGGGAVMFRKPGEEWRNRRDPFEIGRHVVVPLLRKRGVHAIDLLVISHLDSDHIKGLMAVLRDIPVKRILWNGTMKTSGDAIGLFREAIDRRIPLYESSEEGSWIIDEHSRIEVVGSAEAVKHLSGIPVVEEQNGYSVIMLLHIYNRSFLFTGDADAKQERALIEKLSLKQSERSSKPNIDVLKIAHHGSKTSTTQEWLNYWRPAMAVISVGRGNIYGHPYPDVLRRLEQEQVEIMRTDRGGEVQFRVDSNSKLYARSKLAGG